VVEVAELSHAGSAGLDAGPAGGLPAPLEGYPAGMSEGRRRIHERDREHEADTADAAGPVDPDDAAVRARRQAVQGERDKRGGPPGLEEDAERDVRRPEDPQH
jgi:hypothetical protein